MESITITKPTNAVITHNDNGTYTLHKGSVLKDAQPTLTPTLKSIRDKNSYNNITTNDLIFKSLSAVASLIYGCSKNGKVFDIYFSSATMKAPVTKISNTEKPVEEPVEQPVAKATTESPKPSVEKPNGKLGLSLEERKQLIEKFRNFFKEFEWKIDDRCLDTLLDTKDVKAFILNTCELTNVDESIVDRMDKKMNSIEFKQMVSDLHKCKRQNPKINNRLSIYYGDAGTGKTTQAMLENPTSKVVIASATADPDDLFTRFDPKVGGYVLTELGNAMQNGEKVIIDEINLYPSEAHTRLQGVTDNKKSIVDRGMVINIADNFGIVATMNLYTRLDGRRPLPDPLVSRAMVIKKFDIDKSNPVTYIW